MDILLETNTLVIIGLILSAGILLMLNTKKA